MGFLLKLVNLGEQDSSANLLESTVCCGILEVRSGRVRIENRVFVEVVENQQVLLQQQWQQLYGICKDVHYVVVTVR